MAENVNEGSCVAVFERHTDAEAAIRALQRAGFDMKKLSIVVEPSALQDDLPSAPDLMFEDKYSALTSGSTP